MKAFHRVMVAGLVLTTVVSWAPRRVDGNAAGVMFLRLNDEGKLHHVLPRSAAGVRMAAERVVLVPFYDPQSKRAYVLVNGRYDLVSKRSHRHFPVGYPEVNGVYHYSVASNWLSSKRLLKLRQPTIWRLSASVGGRRLRVRAHPGVARYRRWFTFGVPMSAQRPAHLRVRYVSRMGRSLRLLLTDEMAFRFPGLYTWADYWIDYVLHTGALWAGSIGKGEVVLYSEGRHHTLKRFKNLKPTRKDDLTIRLPLGRIVVPKPIGEELDRERLKRWSRRDRLDILQLVHSSSALGGKDVEGLAALAVDGDPASAWISAPRQGVGAWLQLPADPGRSLKSLRVSTLTRSGIARPARVEVLCVRRVKGTTRQTRLATVALPDSASPHHLAVGGARGCAALRIRVLAVHGSATLPVGIAEVEQRYTTSAAAAPRGVKLLPCCYPRKPPKLCRPYRRGVGGCTDTVNFLRRALDKARPAIAKIPRKHLAFGYEIARVSDVRWSADGTVAHYRLWLENEHRDPRAVLMGHFVEVATGKVIGRYRMDKTGTLREPQRTQWKQAVSFEAGARFLDRHRFVKARPGRVPPAGDRAQAKTVLSLRPTLSALSGRLRVKPRRAGFSWWYEPNMVSRRQRRSLSALELVATGTGAQPRRLSLRRPELNHGLAQRHYRARDRRRKRIAKYLKDVQPEKDGSIKPAVAVAKLFPHVHAFTGALRLYWHPTGRAVLAAWQDVKDVSSLLPDSLANIEMKYGGSFVIHPNPWDRLDYARKRAAVTIHPLVATKRTTLRLSPLPKDGSTAAPPQKKAPPTTRVTRPRAGCGCATPPTPAGAPGGPRVPLPLVLVLLFLVVTYRAS